MLALVDRLLTMWIEAWESIFGRGGSHGGR
jgi:hypothetical protein